MRGKEEMRGNQYDIWKCCDQYHAASLSTCSICGKVRSDGLAGDSNTISEHHQPSALELPSSVAPLLAGFTGRVVVGIERHARRELDYDNFIAGCKELRDSIAEALGRCGDSEQDDIAFEYGQVKSNDEKMVISFTPINVNIIYNNWGKGGCKGGKGVKKTCSGVRQAGKFFLHLKG